MSAKCNSSTARPPGRLALRTCAPDHGPLGLTQGTARLGNLVETCSYRLGGRSYLALKKKEDALRELEQSLDERERALAAREAALDDRARQLGKARSAPRVDTVAAAR